MDFPPLDDARWDRLLVAVLGQRPTIADPDSPLTVSFPSLRPRAVVRRDAGQRHADAPGRTTIDLDAYV